MAGTNEAVIYYPGKYNVRADIMFIGGGTASLTNEIIAGYQLGGNCMIEFSLGSLGQLSASIDAMGGTVEQVNWFLDEQPLATGNYIQEIIGLDFHVLSAEVHMTGGVVRKKSVLVNGTSWQHSVNDFTIFEFLSNQNIFRDFNVRLLIEKDGKSFSSELAKNENATLSITGFEYYGKNEQGNDVYKISAIVNANVSEIGSVKTIPVQFSTAFGIEIQ